MRERGVETRERENGKGREEKEALPWQGSEEKGEERGSGAPAAALSFPCWRLLAAETLMPHCRRKGCRAAP